MIINADLHMHSKYARATSTELTLENLEKYARIKGLDIIGTGDFTHPKWIAELKTKLKEDGTGILRSETGFPFLLQTEISLAYTKNGKGRRIHHLILAPDTETVEQITTFLLKKGRVDYDGRPIFGMDSKELAENLHSINPQTELIPAHAWTPWMGIFGSESGFNSLNECFEEKTHLIHAIETGLSSDPPMNWRMSWLDNITLVSNSDSHSAWPWRIGREANIFELKELSYKAIIKAIRSKEIKATIEVDPAYGKYHLDGHRNCGVCLSPKETSQNNNNCPKCLRKLTIGVLNRIEQLADRPEGHRPENTAPYHSIIPLSEIIAATTGNTTSSPKTWKTYNTLIEQFGTELNVLLNATEEELTKTAGQSLTPAIMANRHGQIKIQPGYDGEYGKPILETAPKQKQRKEEPRATARKQKGLAEYL
ncbi:DNA helicase UvrD [Candidatus Woesearchaeota archaeon]|nr:DNA helicase UvrD [Candidatus Woesearchaeota archaeon]